jgi:hypothetical protein
LELAALTPLHVNVSLQRDLPALGLEQGLLEAVGLLDRVCQVKPEGLQLLFAIDLAPAQILVANDQLVELGTPLLDVFLQLHYLLLLLLVHAQSLLPSLLQLLLLGLLRLQLQVKRLHLVLETAELGVSLPLQLAVLLLPLPAFVLQALDLLLLRMSLLKQLSQLLLLLPQFLQVVLALQFVVL